MRQNRCIVDNASLRCADALPAKLVASSRTIGWTSILVDHQQVLNALDPFETASTPDHTIVVMTHGEQEIEVCSRGVWRRAEYRAGTVGMTPGGMTDRLRRRVRPGAGPAKKVNIYVPALLFDEAADHLGRAVGPDHAGRLVALGFADATLRQIAMALLRAVQAGLPDLYAETAARWLAVHLLSAKEGRPRLDAEETRSGGKIDDKRLARVLEFIDAHFSEPVSLDALAAEAGVSKFHFTRLFRRATGTTPHRWLVGRRLEAAQQMLATTDIPLTRVAARCGFPRANHFATQFAKRFGMSPSDYRSGG